MTYSIEEIKKLREGITPGEWFRRLEDSIQTDEHVEVAIIQMTGDKRVDQANGDFIAASPKIVDQLLEEIERLKLRAQAAEDVLRMFLIKLTQPGTIIEVPNLPTNNKEVADWIKELLEKRAEELKKGETK